MTAVIGFGEAASAFVGDADWRGAVNAYDVVEGRGTVGTLAEALGHANVVLSLVTADQALAAACAAAPLLAADALFLDMNSVAPGTKHAACDAVEACGGRYLDVAIMAPVHPGRLAVPLLVAGPHCDAGVMALAAIGFTDVRAIGRDVGRASTIKLIRSVMVKGVEALTEEMMLAAEAAGVADEVLASLGDGWLDKAAYNRERMATHGGRRAAEMEQAASTLASLGIEPVMTRATIVRQREAAQRPLRGAA